MNRLEGKVAIVTGGSQGLGKACCRLLAREGAKVGVTDILHEEGRQTAEEINDSGGNAQFWDLNTTDEDQIRQVFSQAQGTFGKVDVLVNNAGISGPNKPTDQLTLEEWDKVMTVNVQGVFLCTKHVIPLMRNAGGGSIINLSSIYGLIGAGDIPPYHASKGAVRQMSKNDAITYAGDRIRVNSIHPGFIRTPMMENFLKEQGDLEEGLRQLDSLHPIGHVGEPDDIAHGVLYLASDESKFITGSELVIDGGYTAR